MASLFQYVKYGAINTTDTSTKIFYSIMFTSEVYTLQNNTTIDRKIVTADGLFCQSTISLFYARKN